MEHIDIWIPHYTTEYTWFISVANYEALEELEQEQDKLISDVPRSSRTSEWPWCSFSILMLKEVICEKLETCWDGFRSQQQLCYCLFLKLQLPYFSDPGQSVYTLPWIGWPWIVMSTLYAMNYGATCLSSSFRDLFQNSSKFHIQHFTYHTVGHPLSQQKQENWGEKALKVEIKISDVYNSEARFRQTTWDF